VKQNKKLGVYTSSGCPKCSMLKKWLKDRGFAFEEKTLDMEVTADLIMKNVVVLSAPVLEIEGTFYTEDQLFDGDKLFPTQFLRRLEG
jgi:glutaredoxin